MGDMHMTLIRLLRSAAVIALAAPALAQDQEPVTAATGAFGDEIVVTARKRAESLQDVPVAITAFTSDEIQSARIEGLADVAKLTPGLNFTPLFGAQNQLPIIRGAAQTFGQLNVGVFLDGVYLSGKAAVDLELNDLERIEVVRGPQSALYGRNTFAGAINYVTRRPTAEPEARAEVTVGDRGLVRVAGAASGPLGDTVRVRVGGFYRNHNGWYRSSIDGGRVDFAETWGGILTLEWQPAENVLVTWRGSYSDER
jgi:iron complex outermembrane receptor protein